MYKVVRSRQREGDGLSEEFGFGEVSQQASFLSLLLVIILTEALLRDFCTGCPWELLYTDDFMISVV